MIVKFKKNFSSPHRLNFIRDYFWRFLQIFVKQAAGFLLFFIVARNLTSYNFGVYNFLIALVGFLLIFVDFGISSVIAKFVSENHTNREKVKKIFFNSFLIILSLSILAGVGFYFWFFIFNQQYLFYAWFLILLIFLMSFNSLLDGVARGLSFFKKMGKIAFKSYLITLILAFYLVINFNLIGAFLAQICFYFINSLFFLWILRDFISFSPDITILKKVISYASLVGISNLGYFLYSQFNIIILGYFSYFNELNYFKIMNKLIILLAFGFSILGHIIAPLISRLASRSQWTRINYLFTKIIKLTLISSLSISFVVYLLFPFFFKLFLPNLFTPEFLQVFNILIILLPFNLISELIAHGFIIASGEAKLNLLTVLFGSINVLLSFILIKQFGFIGAAYSNVLVGLTSKFVIWYLFYLKIKANKKIRVVN